MIYQRATTTAEVLPYRSTVLVRTRLSLRDHRNLIAVLTAMSAKNVCSELLHVLSEAYPEAQRNDQHMQALAKKKGARR